MTANHSADDLARVQERLRRHRQILTRLGRSETLSTGDIAKAYEQVTELAAELLRVERASVWRLEPAGNVLTCVDLYQTSPKTHSEGVVLRESERPKYFAALASQRCLAAIDAHSDPRTEEFARDYLTPLGIGAMLDAPIWAMGRMVGVVCHEHVGGSRGWTFTDELLAGTIADFVGRVIESAERVQTERDLSVARNQLEELDEIRAQELTRISQELENELGRWREVARSQGATDVLPLVADASRVPLVLTGLDRAEILYANRRAGELFEMSAREMLGMDISQFVLEKADQVDFVRQAKDTGRVDGMVSQVRTHSGRNLSVLITAQRLTHDGRECVFVGFADVTAMQLAEKAVRSSEEGLRSLFGAAPVSLILSRIRDQTVLLANQRAADMFGVPADQVVGRKTPDYYVDPHERDDFLAQLRERGAVDGFRARLKKTSGGEFWAMLTGCVIDWGGERCTLVGVLDVTEQHVLEAQLRELATRDSLTGVGNRRQFLELANRELHRAERHGTPVCLAIVDADHFKRVNDEHGHLVGDRVLIEIVQACTSVLRAADIMARLGGEEFGVLVPDTSMDGALAVAERMRHAIAQVSVTVDDVVLRPTASVGVAALQPAETLSELMRRADRALYKAKQDGRNRVQAAEDPPPKRPATEEI